MGVVRYHGRSYECDSIEIYNDYMGMRIGHTKIISSEGSKFKVLGEVSCKDLMVASPAYCILKGSINLCRVGNILGCAGTVTNLQQGMVYHDNQLKEKVSSIVNSFNSVGKHSNCIRLSGAFESIHIETWKETRPLGVELSGQFEKVRVLDSMYMETGVVEQAWIGNKLILT